ncbi:MAG: metal-dependent hydrolase [Pseudomonadales bacterium]|jgi:inner membrane protein|nr:metal-dependent hydrolase [Pseudomonadales bacterium]
MDPVTQGVLGASVGEAVSRPEKIGVAATLAALAGMAPDLDVLIRSDTDPLLFLEYHRHFTHALAFIPIGALLCAGLFHTVARRWLSFGETYFFCFLGYATHGLLDGCTTYGTQLLWPFSNARFAWNSISVVDPLFTIPALLLVLFAVRRRSPRFAHVALLWMAAYMSLGFVQKVRVESAGEALAASRGHEGVSVSAKPGFANLLLWKVVYEHEGYFHVDAVRAGLTVRAYAGERAERLDVARHLPWLHPLSQQARDIERFRWFSSDHLAWRPERPNEVVDVRYSLLPNEIEPLWGIRLARGAGPEAHVDYWAARQVTPEKRARLLAMLWGEDTNARPIAPRMPVGVGGG